MRRFLRLACAAAAATAISVPSALAQHDKLTIGFITTLTGPQGIIGKHMRDSVELALEHLGGRVGGLPTEVVYADDQMKPDIGVQAANELIKRDHADFVAGVIWSNVMLAVAPTVTGAGRIMVGTNAGASPLAGKQCDELYFSTSWNNDQTPEAMGKYLQEQGVNDLYVMAPNYQAGRDMVAGLKRYYKGRIVEEVYTRLGQQDYQVEISQMRAKSPKALFVFYPGGMGIQFVRQFVQAGLRGEIPLYSVYTVDETTLPALKESALGQIETRFWSPDLDVPASRKYVADFRQKFGYTPSFYGAQSYDGIMLIDSAVRAVKGNLADVKGMVRAMRKADFASVRGPFRYNVNHHPIQDFYLLRATKERGKEVRMEIQRKVFDDHKDAYYEQCRMAW